MTYALARLGARIVAAISLLATLGATAAKAQWSFSLVADASTGIAPSSYASISGQDILFLNGAGTQLYKRGPTGVPVRMFQTGVLIPNTPDNFTYVSFPFSFDGHTFAFFGGVAGGGAAKSGSYAFTSAGLEALSGYGTALANNSNAGRQAIDGDDVAFGGSSAIRVRRAGVVQLINNTTLAPTGGNFTAFHDLDFQNDTIVFMATAAKPGGGFAVGVFYDRGDGTGIHELVSTDDFAPGGSAPGKYASFSGNRGFAFDGHDVAFWAPTTDCPDPMNPNLCRSGLFLSRGFGPPVVVAEYDPSNPTTLPGGPERADGIASIAVSNDEVAFTAASPNQLSRAVFATNGGVLERVVGTGDTLGTHVVDAVGGGNEMFEGDTLVFNVFSTTAARSIWRADRGGLPAVSDSGLIVNGSFGSGLSSWVSSPTGLITPVPGTTPGGPAVQLTADPNGGPAGLAELSQTIPLTPNKSFTIPIDYRFTTTTGSFEVRLNNVLLTSIAAPAAISQAFTRVQVVVNDPSLMGLTNAVLTLQLHPGSLADLFVSSVFASSFFLFNVGEAQADTWAGTGLGNCTQFDDHSRQPTNSLAQAAAQAGSGSNASSTSATAVSASLGPLLGGVQWTMGANAASMSIPTCATAETLASIAYLVSGLAIPGPIPLDQVLLLTGHIELTGDFTQADGATYVRVRFPVTVCHNGDCTTRRLRIAIKPSTRTVSEIIPVLDDVDRNQLNDLTAVLSADPQAIVATFTGPPGGPDTSRRYDIAIQHTFLADTFSNFGDSVHLRVGRAEVVTSADPAFDGTVIADFTQTFDATLTSSTPGIQLLALDGDGDGVPVSMDNCPAASNPTQSDAGGVGAGSVPDGIGDACQCGDVSGNGLVTTADAALITRSLLVPPTAVLTKPELCNVGGSAACTTADAVITTRALLVPATATVQQVCAPALP